MQTLLTNLFTKEFIGKTSLMSFPQAERVGNPSEKKDSGQAGMTKVESSGGFPNDWISNSIAFFFMHFGD